MSGIYIPGLSMPTSCYDCSFSVEAYEGAGFYSCVVTDNCVCKGEGKHDDCPLVPVPDHGDLVDLNEATAAVCCCDGDAWLDTKQIHIVIPASGGDAE